MNGKDKQKAEEAEKKNKSKSGYKKNKTNKKSENTCINSKSLIGQRSGGLLDIIFSRV
jgi:hypothetical protein